MSAFNFVINSAPMHPGSAIYVLKIPWEELGQSLPGKSWPPEQACPDVGGGIGILKFVLYIYVSISALQVSYMTFVFLFLKFHSIRQSLVSLQSL